MSSRYGDRTRSGDSVSGRGRRASSGGTVKQPYEQVFTSPGTWTWPGKVTTVEVFCVGGGGGGGGSGPWPSIPPLAAGGGGGGGGAVLTGQVTVSAPVPVTVGAGGAGGLNANGTQGGASAFGPLGPGPFPLVPASTFFAGGGGGGQRGGIGSVSPGPVPAESRGGGAGGTVYPTPVAMHFGYFGGPSCPGSIGVSPAGEARPGGGALSGGFFLADTWTASSGGMGIDGFGGGGGIRNGASQDGGGSLYGGATLGDLNGRANTGGGGAGANEANLNQTGGTGGSGIVIVRWFE